MFTVNAVSAGTARQCAFHWMFWATRSTVVPLGEHVMLAAAFRSWRI
jgi:hypothetical protein